MGDNGHIERSVHLNESAMPMEVDGENTRRPKSSPLMRSRFNHMNGGVATGQQNGRRNSGELSITTQLRSPVASRRGLNGFASSTVTTVVDEGADPNEQVSVSILRPHSGSADGARIRSSYQGQANGFDPEVIGVVTVSGVTESDKSGGDGRRDEQQVPHPQQPLSFVNGCGRSFIPQTPVIPEPPKPRSFRIHVSTQNGSIYITVEDTTTVEMLMEMLKERTGITPERQVLKFNNRQLERGKTLQEFAIVEGCTIACHCNEPQIQQPQQPVSSFGGCRPSFIPPIPTVVDPPRPRRFQIFVKDLGGKISTYDVEHTTRVETLKDMIKQKLGIPQDQQILQYGGQNLDRGKTLADYNINEGATIFLTGRLRGGSFAAVYSYW